MSDQCELSSLCRLQHQGSPPKGTPRNFDRNRGGVWKEVEFDVNITETGKDRSKVTVEDQSEIPYRLLTGVKIIDLG